MVETEKIKICFFSGDITRSGGTERVGTIIANALVQNGRYDIVFLSLFEKRTETFFQIDRKINRYCLYDREVHGVKYLPGYIQRIHKFVKEKAINVMIDIDGILDMYTIPALKRTKTKLISWEQFNYYQHPYVNYRKFTRRWAAKKADAIVVLTKEDQGYYEKNLKIRHRIQHIYNPILLQQNEKCYDVNSKTIISVGRLAEQKGFDMLLDVAKIVLTKHKDWNWMIVGDGENGEALEEKITQCGLQERLCIYRNVKNVDDYYQKSALYVMTSRYEGFGLVLTEAKAHHLPCVSFRCPCGPAEIIKDGVNGYLVDCFDIQEMAEKICSLIEHEELRVLFAERALEDTEKFDIALIQKQWIELIEELMKKGDE